jgi:DNA-nicking Smr family endonuclease
MAPRAPGRSPDERPATGSAGLGPESDEDLFLREMKDVERLESRSGTPLLRASATPPRARTIVDPDQEVVAELADLVAGTGPFDIARTTEFVEGAVIGLDRRLLRRLRAGEFAYQAHLDLHGMTAPEAKLAVDSFLATAHRRGHRCVLIVHGRGRNSKDQVPVLKRRLFTWLAHGPWARLVLAFTSARSCDGGAGALYVLLRRQRHAKRPIRVTEGACW